MANKTIDTLDAASALASGDKFPLAASGSDTLKRATVSQLQTYMQANLSFGGGGGAEVLSASRTYYVRTDGDDANDGLTDSAGGAFLTLQHACDVASSIVTAGYTITISLGDGTYAEDVTASFPLSTTSIVLTGASMDASLVILNSLTVQIGRVDVTYVNTGSQLNSFFGSRLRATSCIVSSAQAYNGAKVELYDCTFSGDQSYALYSSSSGQIYIEGSFTLSGGPTYGTGFAVATMNGTIESSGATFSGACVGPRYYAELNGVINTYGGGANYFPGDSAGSTATGGQYA